MDSLITAAARALAAGDPLGALKRVALRDDAPALALRGIAMAQLGDLVRAKALLRSAARAFGPKEPMARARCVVAEAEIALASRDLTWSAKALEAARATLEAHGDRANAAHVQYLQARRLLLIGRIDEAERTLAELDHDSPSASRASTVAYSFSTGSASTTTSRARRGASAKPRFVAVTSARVRSALRSRPTSTRRRARYDSSARFARNARATSASLGTSPGHASPSARASANNTGRFASEIIEPA